MTKPVAKTHTSSANLTRNCPDTSEIHDAPIGSNILVYHPKTDK